ncbi:MAG TPA: c-type cytochrome [Bacteroidia bacterium]|nr:c-type cytochrome [Bacteroidia bacterium]HNP97487.1 c-type cytochrome [Bacteroidia bacterium]
MKKLLKIIGYLVLLVIVVIGGFAAFISIRGVPSYDVNVPQVAKIEVTPERVAHGKKIASMLCNNCHFNSATGKFTGREMTEVPEFGKIVSRNITQDPEIGIGKWSDAQLTYFIRTGINPFTGKYSPPYMPKLMHISDEDLNSIIAFLHSDDPLVQADKTEGPVSEPSFLTKFLCLVAFKPFPFPEKPIPNPDTTNQLEWGKYLALYQLECFACHSADFKKMNVFEPEKSLGFFGGGNVMRNDHGEMITTLNLTPDEETGIGKWTEEEFVKAVKFGIVPNGPALRNPMVPFAQLTDEEAKAIYAYLRTVPKIKHAISRGL